MAMTREELFWSRINKNGPVHPVLGTPCWLWTGAQRRRGGYGRIKVNGKNVAVHRFAWKEIAGREIPEGHGVLHHCDVKLCANYETHLFTGTDAENMRDRDQKGRQAQGERHGFRTHPESIPRGDRSAPKLHPENYIGEKNGASKVTEAQVVEIRALCAAGAKRREIAAQFGICRTTVQRLNNGTNWAHVHRLPTESTLTQPFALDVPPMT